MHMRKRVLGYAVALALGLMPYSVALAATTIGNNVSVGGTLTVTGLTTLTGGFISSASSTIASSLNVSGNLNASSTVIVGQNIIPTTTNSGDLGAMGNAFANVFVSSTLTIGGNGSTVSSTPIRAHLSMLTTAINLADVASSTAKCTSSSVTVSGAALGDTVLVSPLTYDDASVAGQLTAVPTAANTVVIMYCAPNADADRDMASMLYRIDVWKH